MKLYLNFLSLAFCFILPVAFAEDACVTPPLTCQIDSNPGNYSCKSNTTMNLSACSSFPWSYRFIKGEYVIVGIAITKDNKNYANYSCQKGWSRTNPSSQKATCN